MALAKAGGARAVILVEGISDQIAVETVAARRGLDLGAEGVAVVPAGGAHGFARYARRFGPRGAGIMLAGLLTPRKRASFGVAWRRPASVLSGHARTWSAWVFTSATPT